MNAPGQREHKKKEQEYPGDTAKHLLFNGPIEKYRVKFTYPKGGKEVITVEAHSFPEAVNRAQMSRRPNKYPPSVCDIIKVG